LVGAAAASCSEDPPDASAVESTAGAAGESTSEALGGERTGVNAGGGGASADLVEGGAAGAPSSIPADLLSGTGLYADLAQSEALADGVVEYRPRFELWSDGAEKRRFVRLPEHALIDSSDPDFWTFPVGTRAWKEFWRGGVRVETRLLAKLSDERWFAMAYAWNDAQTEALAVRKGLSDAQGTGHDIPSQVMCGECHDNVPDRLLGVSSLQLSHDLPGLTLGRLVSEGRLSAPPQILPELPGDAVAQSALGYLHANCGNCHNPRSGIYATVQLRLWLEVESLSSVQATTTYQSSVGVPLQGVPASADVPQLRITPGSPDESAIQFRMADRDPLVQMPPLASKLADDDGLARVGAWIRSLSSP
jgi:hypothetical protein